MYRVKFYKELLSSDGHCFRCLQHSIDVPATENEADAIRFGTDRFQQLKHGQDWRIFADMIEVERLQ